GPGFTGWIADFDGAAVPLWGGHNRPQAAAPSAGFRQQSGALFALYENGSMTPVYLASGGVVCHAGRGLHALQKGLLAPASRPHYRTLTEITPAVTVPWLPATQLDEENSAMALATAAVADALVAYSPTQRRNMALFIASSSADLIGRERVYTAAVARGESALPWIRPGAGLLASRLAEQFGLG